MTQYTAVLIESAGIFYRLALLLNGKPVSYVFGSGDCAASLARLQAEAADRNHTAEVFAAMDGAK